MNENTTPMIFDETINDPNLLSSHDNPRSATSEKSSQGYTGNLAELSEEENWILYRSQALMPLALTDLVTTQQTRDEFIRGCELLGVTMPKPHQLVIADMLNAGKEENAILMPRQSGKTSTLSIVLVGRCASRDRYNTAFTLSTLAGKTAEVFSQVIADGSSPWEWCSSVSFDVVTV